MGQLRERYGLETHISWPQELLTSPLTPEIETQLLRIIQESLTNVRKHAEVKVAHLFFTLHVDEIQVMITDDGVGFSLSPNPQSPVPNDHFGLIIMRERAEAVGGTLEIRSRPDHVTQVIVRLPRRLETARWRL